MMQMKANSFLYVNMHSLKVTDVNDPDALEFVHLFLKGQSFLYNQIRKMVGSMIQVFHGMLDREIIQKFHKDDTVNVAMAPGDGLMLEKVGYDKYNTLPQTKEPVMLKLVSQKKEVDRFRDEIVQYIAKREIKDRAFTSWLSWLDDNRDDYYIEFYNNNN